MPEGTKDWKTISLSNKWTIWPEELRDALKRRNSTFLLLSTRVYRAYVSGIRNTR